MLLNSGKLQLYLSKQWNPYWRGAYQARGENTYVSSVKNRRADMTREKGKYITGYKWFLK